MSASSEENNENNEDTLENEQQQQGSQQLTVPITTGLAHTLVPTSLAAQLASLEKPKRKQVKNACVNCQKACKKCDDGRPCQRCIKYEITGTCKNSIRKERRRGIKRGPYKRRKLQRAQDNKPSTTSTSSDSYDIPTPNIAPDSDGQISENPTSNNKFPVISPQILETKEPTIVTTPDGIRKFIIIPQSSAGTLYYILMPVQQQNQISISASKASTVQDKKAGIKFEHPPKEPEKLLLEADSRRSKSDTTEVNWGTFKKEKDKSNLSVLSRVCSDLLNQDTIPYEQTNKEIFRNRPQSGDSKSLKVSTPKQNINKPVSWNLIKNERNQVDSVRDLRSLNARALTSTSVMPNNRVTFENTAYATPNEDHPPSFETPSVGSPLLFSIPANTYPVAPAQYMPIKRESSIDDNYDVKLAKHEFQFSQNNVSFSQNQIPMQQPYYEIPPFITPPRSITSSSNSYMTQNQIPSFYQLRYKMSQQVTPTLSFAFSPGASNINTSQSQTHGYANVSASSNGSQGQNYSM